jgi:hypothetical protein
MELLQPFALFSSNREDGTHRLFLSSTRPLSSIANTVVVCFRTVLAFERLCLAPNVNKQYAKNLPVTCNFYIFGNIVKWEARDQTSATPRMTLLVIMLELSCLNYVPR